MDRSLKHRLKQSLMKVYKYFVWGYGYRVFLRFQGYRLLSLTAAAPGPGAFRILTFHHVPEAEHKAFDRLIRHVLDAHGFLTPAEAEARLAGDAPPVSDSRIPCLLSFDDGFASNVTLAQEVLSRHGIKAIFFVCPGLIDIARERHRDAIVRYIFESCISEANVSDDMTFMTWSGVEELVRSGHTIGSHTLHHLRLTNLGDEEQRREIVGSADYLEDKLGVPIEWFAYPFGDLGSIDANSLEIIAGRYRFCCSGLRGLNSTATSPMELLREAVDLTSPFEFQHLVLAGGMDFRHQKKVKQLAALVGGRSTPIKRSGSAMA